MRRRLTMCGRIGYSVRVIAKHRPSPQRDESLCPPKSIAELEREQGLAGVRPDYVALASAVWRTRAELREFQKHVRAIRRASK